MLAIAGNPVIAGAESFFSPPSPPPKNWILDRIWGQGSAGWHAILSPEFGLLRKANQKRIRRVLPKMRFEDYFRLFLFDDFRFLIPFRF